MYERRRCLLTATGIYGAALHKDSMTSVDGIPVPCEVLDEAQRLANQYYKAHFVGVCEEKNPDFKEPEGRTAFSLSALAPVLTLEHDADRRYRLTGEWIISDDREAVLEECGRLIWVMPQVIKDAARIGEGKHTYQEAQCAACKEVPTLTEGTTDKGWARITRGALALQNADGTLSYEELGERENVKFEIMLCGDCFLKDPDLCAFFNKIGKRVR